MGGSDATRSASPVQRSRSTLARYTLDTLLQEDLDTALFDRSDRHRVDARGSLVPLRSELHTKFGQEYPLDFFQAERHVVRSNLRIDTTLELVPDVVR